MKNGKNDHRVKIAESVVKFAKEQKIGIHRAIHRAQNSKRFESAINTYAKAKRIGVTEAWRRIINLVGKVA